MLDVFLHGIFVGKIEHQSETNAYSFCLGEEYLNDPNRPVLGQRFEDRRSLRVFKSSRPGTLPAFFANLLPEGALRQIVENQATAKDEAELLAILGEDLPGAVVIRPESSRDPLKRSAGKTFTEQTSQVNATQFDDLRFSLAGVQLKFSAVQEEDKRFTLPFQGMGGSWILKFGTEQYHSLPENEFWTMSWAKECGIITPAFSIVSASSIHGLDKRFIALGESVFAIERFDRPRNSARIHQEDFAQILSAHPFDPDSKYRGWSYEGIARFVADICTMGNLEEYLKRLIFMIISGNTDAHLKNWSLIYSDTRHASLSPLYDFVFVRQYIKNNRLALPLFNEKDPTKITWKHIEKLEQYLLGNGHSFQIKEFALEFIEKCLDTWITIQKEISEPYRSDMNNFHNSLSIITK
jgi:serine/threonine-protein kinase HipA